MAHTEGSGSLAAIVRRARRLVLRAALLAFGVVAFGAVAGGAFAAVAGGAFAAAGAIPPEPTIGDFVLDWSFDPTIQVPIIVAAIAWIMAVRRVDAAHPSSRVPIRRSLAFLGALVTVEVALQSGIGRYDDVLFLDHMVQHVLLTMVAAPLFVLSAPITLALRVARPVERRRIILPILHSRFVRVVSFPVTAWILFAAFLWGSHFSPLFEAALENPLVHDVEHALFLGTAMLFWWPAAGVDPSPWRMPHPARVLYVFLQMPQNTFLALSIFSANVPLYAHYVSIGRTWGSSPLADQQAAGAFMWVAGDMMFLVAVLAVVYDWMRHEERETARVDARLDAELAVIREREAALAARRAIASAEAGMTRASASGRGGAGDGVREATESQ